jgi:hypothetical protein
MNNSIIRSMQLLVLAVLILAGFLYLVLYFQMTGSSARYGQSPIVWQIYLVFFVFMISSFSMICHGVLLRKDPDNSLAKTGTVITAITSMITGLIIIFMMRDMGETGGKILILANSLSISLGIISLYLSMPDKGSLANLKKAGMGMTACLFLFTTFVVLAGASSMDFLKIMMHFLQVVGIANSVVLILCLYLAYGMIDGTDSGVAAAPDNKF